MWAWPRRSSTFLRNRPHAIRTFSGGAVPESQAAAGGGRRGHRHLRRRSGRGRGCAHHRSGHHQRHEARVAGEAARLERARATDARAGRRHPQLAAALQPAAPPAACDRGLAWALRAGAGGARGARWRRAGGGHSARPGADRERPAENGHTRLRPRSRAAGISVQRRVAADRARQGPGRDGRRGGRRHA